MRCLRSPGTCTGTGVFGSTTGEGALEQDGQYALHHLCRADATTGWQHGTLCAWFASRAAGCHPVSPHSTQVAHACCNFNGHLHERTTVHWELFCGWALCHTLRQVQAPAAPVFPEPSVLPAEWLLCLLPILKQPSKWLWFGACT